MSQNKIAELCHQDESVFGCDWDIALSELEQAYNVENMTGDEEKIRDVFLNSPDPQPVIVVLGDRSGSLIGTHAVAILDIVANAEENETEQVCFYDPERGEVLKMRGVDFWSAWSLGGYAFTVQP